MLFSRVLVSSLWSGLAVLPVATSRHFPHDVRGHLRQRDGIFEGSIWSGAFLSEPSGTFSSVTGTITVPSVSGSEGEGGSIWVGIDGLTCSNTLLATGIGFNISDGSPSYYAWSEWYPGVSKQVESGIDISVGDAIKLTITADTSTSGSITVDNLTNGQSVSHSVSSSYTLCGQDAVWIVQEYEPSGQTASLAEFSIITFTDTQATGGSGSVTAAGATVSEIERDDVFLSVSIDPSGDVTVGHA